MLIDRCLDSPGIEFTEANTDQRSSPLAVSRKNASAPLNASGQTLQQQPNLAHLSGMIHTCVGLVRDMDAQSPRVLRLRQLADQPAIFDFTLPDADLQLSLARITQVDVTHIFYQMVVVDA